MNLVGSREKSDSTVCLLCHSGDIFRPTLLLTATRILKISNYLRIVAHTGNLLCINTESPLCLFSWTAFEHTTLYSELFLTNKNGKFKCRYWRMMKGCIHYGRSGPNRKELENLNKYFKNQFIKIICDITAEVLGWLSYFITTLESSWTPPEHLCHHTMH